MREHNVELNYVVNTLPRYRKWQLEKLRIVNPVAMEDMIRKILTDHNIEPNEENIFYIKMKIGTRMSFYWR